MLVGSIEMTAITQSSSEALWNSQEPSDVLRFYMANQNVDDLVRFSRARPRAAIHVTEIRPSAKSQVVVVIPVANLEDPYLKNLAFDLRPLPIVVVQSNGQFFNYATSINRGIAKALESNPTWIVVMNSDMFVRDSAETLVDLLSEVHADVAIARTIHETSGARITVSNLGWDTLVGAFRSLRHLEIPPVSWLIPSFERKYGVHNRVTYGKPSSNEEGWSLVHGSHSKRFPLQYLWEGPYRHMKTLRGPFQNFGGFGIFKHDLIEENLLDEIYINGFEDLDLAYRLAQSRKHTSVIDFHVGRYGSLLLSPNSKADVLRRLRNILGLSYFAQKNLLHANEGAHGTCGTPSFE